MKLEQFYAKAKVEEIIDDKGRDATQWKLWVDGCGLKVTLARSAHNASVLVNTAHITHDAPDATVITWNYLLPSEFDEILSEITV
jgi:hypothetical protein